MIRAASTPGVTFSADTLRDLWAALDHEERVEGFELLPSEEAEEFFLELSAQEQADLLLDLPSSRRRLWVRLLAPDDAADVLQAAPEETRSELLALIDRVTRREVEALLAYAEDQAGGLMSPRFARVRPDSPVDVALRYLRQQARDRLETIYYAYVLDHEQRLLGVVSFRDLFTAPPDRLVQDVMRTDIVTLSEDMDQEAVAREFDRHDLMALPVVDAAGRMKGIVTFDDIGDVVQEEATEDFQKLGGMEALEAPYLNTGLLSMVKKRGGWLAALFLGEMLTATAMARYEDEIAAAVVLALFVPLIISSGGNSGSQATTLVIRAMALREVRRRDWWRVARREVVAGLLLGVLLATIGLARILLWQSLFGTYGGHALLLGLTVAGSLVAVVAWGTIVGSMLPFLLRSLGADPASASAPFVATLVDVSGVVIYFTMAKILLTGTLL